MEKIQIRNWYFLLDDIMEACQKDYNDSNWQKVRVPHDWSIHQAFSKKASSGTGYLPGGIGWYRSQFKMTSEDKNKQLRLFFEGVYKNSQVWVNGYHVGGRPSGYASFSFDITEIASYSHDGILNISVRVDHRDIADSRWYTGSGINRPVWLEKHEKLQVCENSTFFSTVESSKTYAVVCLEQAIFNGDDKASRVKVQQVLTPINKKGNTYKFNKIISLQGRETKTLIFKETLQSPLLWSDKTPNMYRLQTIIKNLDTQCVSQYEEFVGIRTMTFDANTGFFVNNENVKIKGVCLHEDSGCFGTAVPAVVWLRRLLKLKEGGANGIRMAHNPHSKILYKLCDILGFYVIDEAFDEWENPKNKWWKGHNVYPPKHEGYAKNFPNWHQSDLENLIFTNRNHPSIISWSIGNEIDYPNDPYASPLFEKMIGNNDATKPKEEQIYNPNRPDIRRLSTLAEKLVILIKSIDNTRPVTLAAAFPELSSQTGLLNKLDLIGYNYKEHLYELDHKRFPKQPIIGSENGHGYQQWLAVKNNDFISGQFLWTGIDYLGEAHGWPIHGSSAGLLTLAGIPKPYWYLRKSWWSEQPILKVFTRPIAEKNQDVSLVNRQWDYPFGEKIEVVAFSNCEEVTLFSGNISYDMVFDEELGFFKAIVSVTNEKLKAIGKKNEGILIDSLINTQPMKQLSIETWKTPDDIIQTIDDMGLISKSSPNIYQILVQLVDNNGSLVKDKQLLSVEVVDGTLLGIENGDLSDITNYKLSERHIFEGSIVIFVEGNSSTTVKIKVDGLEDKLLTLY